MQKIGKMLRFLSLMVGILLVFTAQAYSAEYANLKLLVSPADIEKNMGKWIVLDCRSKADYDAGHILGAIHIGDTCSKGLRDIAADGVTRQKKQEDIEKVLGDAGISPDKTVVVYGDIKDPNVQSAGVGFFVLEYWGQKDVRFLNGGMDAWTAEGKKLETAPAKLPPAKFKAAPNPKILASTDDVLKIAKGEVKDVNLIDCRSTDEYLGKTPGKDVKRGGRIPNTTVHVNHLDLYDKATGKIKSMAELDALYGKVDKSKRTIGYCRTGTRSSLGYLVKRVMGFKDPVNYQDSWIVWGNREDLPIEK